MQEPLQRPGLLKVSLIPEAPCLFLSLRGELDLSSVDQVPRDEYATREDLTTVLVDLGELTFCDATGIRALVSFARSQTALGRSVAVLRAHPFIWRLMGICGITDRLEVEPREVPPGPRGGNEHHSTGHLPGADLVG